MSRIGHKPIAIPTEVTVTLTDNTVYVKGPKGELTQPIPSGIKVEVKDQTITVHRQSESKPAKSLHGLTRSLIANMIIGVTQGFKKTLELVGTGYRVKKEDDHLVITVGFSHPIIIKPLPGIQLDVIGDKKIIISGPSKQQVGQIAADIRSIKKPEPYKGKGIRYQGEVVRRKAGKAAKVGAAAGA